MIASQHDQAEQPGIGHAGALRHGRRHDGKYLGEERKETAPPREAGGP
ncbi:hypothetical protein L547_0621 [Bordetella pertussis H918]|nr:hypothetical protein V483_0299 [Bordetella pertussis CHLA-11]ETG99039.1 hypothetical protein L569_0302 [Bordetella pertussis 2250905]ETH05601.1 hypothetical protein L570_0284 [Bordetella pertussis 2356847]ETH06715.1 hypothetical protein L571_0291 [Bordetella pertussis 2371640]ETH22946.1 hypothetical protein L564_0292 [Bordetella pertussis CHLA-15]ETH27397.1 hypothetical protein L565_0287 [Bordetella pertussis CHLA-20]ETH33620.1 hypothetical protein L546_0312 [Bordetella pertussis H897]ETH